VRRYAHEYAGHHQVVSLPGKVSWLLDPLQIDEDRLEEARSILTRASEKEFTRSYAAEWLLDNYYVVQQALREVREDMPARFYRRLPKLSGAEAGEPRIYAVAQEIIHLTAATLTFDQINSFVVGYQEVAELTIGEIWALPAMLRAGVIHILAHTVGRIANLELPADEPALEFKRTSDEDVVANAIISLRYLATQDWNVFFRQVSKVEHILSQDPAGYYQAMDIQTKDRYRKIVEELASGCTYTESEVAGNAVNLARQGDGLFHAEIERKQHVGYYLIDSGRMLLERTLGYRTSLMQRGYRWFMDHATIIYLGSISVIGGGILLGLLSYAMNSKATVTELVLIGLLAFVPAASIAPGIVNWILTHILKPRVLPKLDFREGIPGSYRTMVVIPALLSDAEEVSSLLHQLEIHFLSNQDGELFFALLTDFVDAGTKQHPEDDALVTQAVDGVIALNEEYLRTSETGADETRPFFLFHRERVWNPGERAWMGWERKRGKLEEFNRLLLGRSDTSFSVQYGDLSILPTIKYVITLDADTILPRDSAHRLVGTLAHPLNRACYDPGSGSISAGYTVIQPRTEIKPTSSQRTLFSRIFSGDPGLDLYTLAVSDVYQDLFGECIYVGKGIYDVRSFAACMDGRISENTLLSHDLFEGLHVRAALASDIVLLEDYPPTYLAYAKRLHRWIRGDWQLLSCLQLAPPKLCAGEGRRSLSAIDYWKIADNLFRSLLMPSLLALLICGWFLLPGSALVWTAAVLITPVVPLFSGVSWFLIGRIRSRSTVLRQASFGMQGLRWLLTLTFLPYEAFIALDAIVRTVIRMTVTHRNLLEWTTAAHAGRLFGNSGERILFWRHMGISAVAAGAAAVILAMIHPRIGVLVSPLLFAWLIAPHIAYSISQKGSRRAEPLHKGERYELRCLARQTWLFFERFTGPEDHWLPPDHFQESPLGSIAHRTSPTNIGLMLASTLGAYESGYIDLPVLSMRLRNSFDTLKRLERYRGHFLNWYDTRSLTPLLPRYVSTVDSGNLALSLLAVKTGCAAACVAPIMQWQRWQGLLDTIDVLDGIAMGLEEGSVESTSLQEVWDEIRSKVLNVRNAPQHWGALLIDLDERIRPEMDRRLIALIESSGRMLDAQTIGGLRMWIERVHNHLITTRRCLHDLSPWLELIAEPPEVILSTHNTTIKESWKNLIACLPACPCLHDIASVCRQARSALGRVQAELEAVTMERELLDRGIQWCVLMAKALDSAEITGNRLVRGLETLSQEADEYASAMDFEYLFEPQRQLFRIGYNVDSQQPDSNYYDLLASEARVASLFAIAKGDVPQSHWLHLGRALVAVNGMTSLVSWSGSMFEYLMPALFVVNDENTLLGQSTRAAVKVQIEYGRSNQVPWGISEAGYHRFDAGKSYQYRAFGVPGLGFKRGLGDDLVVAPYASLLALPLRPRGVVQNIGRLTSLGLRGAYGFYESVDFTGSRLTLGQKRAIVKSYYSHHQGMIFLSLVNYLLDGVMVQRIGSDPLIRTVELLLHEQIPYQVPTEDLKTPQLSRSLEAPPNISATPWTVPVKGAFPLVHVLSNGRFGVMLTNAGGGGSRWHSYDLTRWRADTTLDDWGTWIYIQDRETGRLWSSTLQPIGAQGDSCEVSFLPHKVEYLTQANDISAHTEVAIPPDDDLEIRRLTLTNLSDRARRLRISSYGEVVLAPFDTDRRHQAFNKLFIESEYLQDLNALVFRRRLRSEAERAIYLLHLLTAEPGVALTRACETDRGRFLGRGRTMREPSAFDTNSSWVSNESGATLDPIMSLGQDIDLEAKQSVQVAYITAAAPSRRKVLDLAGRYVVWTAISRAFSQTRSQSERELRQLEMTTRELELVQVLLSLLLYSHAALRGDPSVLGSNQKGQSGLWPFAISGDYPIMLVRIRSDKGLPLVQELVRAHTYWRARGLRIDLVILNLMEGGYAQELHGRLYRLLTHTNSDAWLQQRGGIFILNNRQLGKGDTVLLATAARAVLDDTQGSLEKQLSASRKAKAYLPAFVPMVTEPLAKATTPQVERPGKIVFDNDLGGFSHDGHAYMIYLKPGQYPPAPWINVIANSQGGCLVSEGGGMMTWAFNSGENRLTPWYNDPVGDRSGEALYIRDEETAEVWSPMPLPCGAQAAYLIRHEAGSSTFEHQSHGLKQTVRVFMAPDQPVKIIQVGVENLWNRVRRITVTFYVEWVLGGFRDVMSQYIIPDYDASHRALLVRNPYNTEFGEHVAFLATTKEPHGLTTDRTEFIGRLGSLKEPAALKRIGLSSTVEAGHDPCAALQLHIDLLPGASEEVAFLLGEGRNGEEALHLIEQHDHADQVQSARATALQKWDRLLGCVQVQTPDQAMDFLLNRWLPYQNLSCRFWGRSALYQSSGAFGFRDQLQDSLALLHAAPELTRDHILRCSRHQFQSGDVLHWFHPPSGRGVRTRISDDLLWLPFVTAAYIEATNDRAILSERVQFLQAPALNPDEEERYGLYESTEQSYSLYEHCVAAIRRGVTAGPHGLPLIGTGDWNDGLNRVGAGGKGESIWLGWFICAVLAAFEPICRTMGDDREAAFCRESAKTLQHALETHGWDGAWYRRGYYDDTGTLGSAKDAECRIDSIAQSWAVISGAGAPERTQEAMKAVVELLISERDDLIQLLTPPFDKVLRDPGYIKGYPPGVRENGGQYTHAALWVVWAFTMLGDGDRAQNLFRMLNPVYHCDTPEKVSAYRVEPYVVAADVYSVPPFTGRGGWTWYTGSGGWMYRLGLEAILGLRRSGTDLIVHPCIPRAWKHYEIRYKAEKTECHIQVENPNGVNQGVKEILVDGTRIAGKKIALASDGKEHRVEVTMG